MSDPNKDDNAGAAYTGGNPTNVVIAEVPAFAFTVVKGISVGPVNQCLHCLPSKDTADTALCGATVCPHGRLRPVCRECGGVSICVHGRPRRRCRECGGKTRVRQPPREETLVQPIPPPLKNVLLCSPGLCPHMRQQNKCPDCKGASICKHRRQRNLCRDCGGASICTHGRNRSSCPQCPCKHHGVERYFCTDCLGDEACQAMRLSVGA